MVKWNHTHSTFSFDSDEVQNFPCDFLLCLVYDASYYNKYFHHSAISTAKFFLNRHSARFYWCGFYLHGGMVDNILLLVHS